jgi:hypothetical protein
LALAGNGRVLRVSFPLEAASRTTPDRRFRRMTGSRHEQRHLSTSTGDSIMRTTLLAAAIAATLGTCAAASAATFRYPAGPRGAGAVLYDQSGTPASGTQSQTFESSYDAYDSAAADDFAITDANGWTVSAFNFQVQAEGASPASATFDINVYADAGGSPAQTPTCSYSALPGTFTADNTGVSVALSTPCTLPAGTYWVSETANLVSISTLLWSEAALQDRGADAVWRNPNGGFGSGCADWTPLASCGNPAGAGLSALLFQVIGAVNGGGTECAEGGICLTVTLGTDVSAGACGSADSLDVTVGDPINLCYRVTNSTSDALDYQSLSDNISGIVVQQQDMPLAPGATLQYNRIVTASATQTLTSQWTAQDVPTGYMPTKTTASVPDRVFCDGFDGNACAGSGDFIDVRSVGTEIDIMDDDGATVTMPFSFDFYGVSSNVLSVSDNGGFFVGFPGALLTAFNDPLPTFDFNSAPTAILPLWDDFEGGTVYYATIGSAPNRRFVVEWYDSVHYPAANNTEGATFEVIIDETTNAIWYEYADVDYTATGASQDPADCTGGACATIGLQDTATLASQYSYDTASVADRSGIEWTFTNPQVFTSSSTVQINVGSPVIAVDPPSLQGTVPAGGSTSFSLDIENSGDRQLTWSAADATAPNAHFPVPGTRFALSRGPATPSDGLVRRSRAGKPRNASHRLSGAAVPAFASDTFNDEFVTFDAQNPSPQTVIAGAGGTAVKMTFDDADFSTALGIDGIGTDANELVSIDTASGAITPIADVFPIDGEHFNGFKYDRATQKYFAISSDCKEGSHLYTVDPTSGAVTLIGEIPGSPCMIDIAIDSRGLMYGVDISDAVLYAIDKTTANASLIGGLGFSTNYAEGLDFDHSTDTLYFAGIDADNNDIQSMYTINVDTGLAMPIAPLSPDADVQIVGLAIEKPQACDTLQALSWLTPDPASGTTDAGATSSVTLAVDASASSNGDVLTGTACLSSNDPQHHIVAIPVTVSVGPPSNR